jgi:flagellar FliL protein
MADGVENTGSKKKLFILMALAVTLLIGVGGAVWLLMGDDTPEPEMTASVNQPASAVVEPAYYVIMPQPFIFNVVGDKRDRVVQVKVQLMVRGNNNEALALQHIPLIESTLLQSFGAATVEQLRTPNGRIDLRKQALFAIQSMMEKISGQQVVDRVLFTGFVMQ